MAPARPMPAIPRPRSKLLRLGDAWRDGGMAAVARLAVKNPPLAWCRPSWWRRMLGDERLWARWVEFRGDRVTIEGCRFRVGGTAAIPTWRKSLFTRDRYEIEERRALARHLDPTLPVVEFGGSIGVVACIVNRRLEAPERHVVVEPNPEVVPLLAENRYRNRARFEILPRAIAYGAPRVAFRCRDFLDSGLHGSGGRAVQVDTTTFAEVVANAGIDRCTLICDIEGEEVALVAHELDALCRHAATIVLETHPGVTGSAAVRDMLARLWERGFVEVFRDADTVVLRQGRDVAAAAGLSAS